MTWGIVTSSVSLVIGATAVFWADFGMPGWFFLFTQIWFWTLGLPAMLGVRAVVALWGIPGLTTLPLWLFGLCAWLTAIGFQCGCFFLLNRIVRRFAEGRA